ncbi:hypothetical protein ACMX25_38310 [Caballeronia sp. 15715]|uniref:hypothetical protein n=1 Tax=Caballeronia sp. 15715 TaxID=3391030 RepID=UPI0039E5A25A
MNTLIERHLYSPALVTPMLLLVSEMGSLEFSFFDAIRLVALKGVQYATVRHPCGVGSTSKNFIFGMRCGVRRILGEI